MAALAAFVRASGRLTGGGSAIAASPGGAGLGGDGDGDGLGCGDGDGDGLGCGDGDGDGLGGGDVDGLGSGSGSSRRTKYQSFGFGVTPPSPRSDWYLKVPPSMSVVFTTLLGNSSPLVWLVI